MKQGILVGAVATVAFLSGAFLSSVVAQERLMRINSHVGTYVTQTQGNNKQVALDVIMGLIVENVKLKKAAGQTE
jgi:hypothetical protein